jgi:hypothetical protein
MTNQLSFTVSDANGTTTIAASLNEVVVKKIDLPTAAFDVLAQIDVPTANKEVQQRIAAACAWPLNSAGRCPKAAALLERITPGYSVFNGTIAVLVASSEGKARFFQFNENLQSESKAQMLTRQKKAEAAAPVHALSSDPFETEVGEDTEQVEAVLQAESDATLEDYGFTNEVESEEPDMFDSEDLPSEDESAE